MPSAKVVIGADTMIIAPPEDIEATAANSILGKPRDEADARAILSRLSGKTHHVVTGVSMIVRAHTREQSLVDKFSILTTLGGASGEVFVDTVEDAEGTALKVNFYSKTMVQFEDLDIETINEYVASGEPMDKAGAYGIQALGGSFVRAIEGCYWNVVGFPMNQFSRIFKKLVELMD